MGAGRLTKLDAGFFAAQQAADIAEMPEPDEYRVDDGNAADLRIAKDPAVDGGKGDRKQSGDGGSTEVNRNQQR